MTLKECYAQLEGDYEGVVGRLQGERLVRKFAVKFLDDPSFDNLRKALSEKQYEEAFRAAHTIKGVCQNLGFSKLLHSSEALTEALRPGEETDVTALLEAVEQDYLQTVCAIRTLAEEA